jgi:hypothetical protein
MGPWYYISVLNHAAKHAHVAYESYELYTCCDLCVDADGSECLTFTRGNGSFLDLDTVFAEVREATNEERIQLFDALVKAFKDHDLGWANHFTDSSYFDILDWLSREFNVDFEDDSNQNHPLCEIISEIQDYIWDALCKETGNYHACTDYEEPEMVNKQEFIEKVKEWLEKTLYIHTEIEEDRDFCEIYRTEWVTSDYDTVEDFINGFCKEMEE